MKHCIYIAREWYFCEMVVSDKLLHKWHSKGIVLMRGWNNLGDDLFLLQDIVVVSCHLFKTLSREIIWQGL